MTRYEGGGHKASFLTNSLIIVLKILRGGGACAPLAPRSLNPNAER